MKNKSGFSKKLERIVAGKGFYIVLFLCVAVIGVSAWSIVDGTRKGGEDDLGGIVDVIAVNSPSPAAPSPKVSDSGAAIVSPKPSTAPPAETPSTVETPPSPATVENTEPEAPPERKISELVFAWPVSGSIAVEFSPDALIYNRTMADWRTHNGIDIGAQMGTKVLATADGTVESVYADDLYGTTVVIYHTEGLRSVYSNLAATPTVSEGDTVSMGAVIGSVGDTTLIETGEVAHLHFEVTLNGESVDPANYLPKR